MSATKKDGALSAVTTKHLLVLSDTRNVTELKFPMKVLTLSIDFYITNMSKLSTLKKTWKFIQELSLQFSPILKNKTEKYSFKYSLI